MNTLLVAWVLVCLLSQNANPAVNSLELGPQIPLLRAPPPLLGISTEPYPRQQSSAPPGYNYAVMKTHIGEFYGTKVVMNVWGPELEDSRMVSLAQLWVVAGPYNDLNSIEVGWTVFRDNTPRLFVYYTANGYKSGCHNENCDGFVPNKKSKIAPGEALGASSYNGSQHEIEVTVLRDRQSGNWTIKIDGEVIGYYPKTLFTHLAGPAYAISWGGEVFNPTKLPNPPMGSGRFPRVDGYYRKVAYMRKIEVVNEAYEFVDAPLRVKLSDKPLCYKIYDPQKIGPRNMGRYIYFGGPGGLCSNESVCTMEEKDSYISLENDVCLAF